MDNKKNNKKQIGFKKPNNMKYILMGLAGAVIIAVALIIYFTTSKGYVAQVGNEKISVEEYNMFLSMEKSRMLNEAGIAEGTPDEETFWSTKILGENAIDVAKKNALDTVAGFKLQVAKAKEQKLSLSKEQINEIEDLVKNYRAQYKSRSEANADFKSVYGISLDGYQELLKQSELIGELYMKETQAMLISQDEVKSYYDENTESFIAHTVRHILISYTGEEGDRDTEESEKLAEELLQRIKDGEDMIELALEYSEDRPGVEQNQGEYTFTKDDSFVNEFKNWGMQANIGDVGIVETLYGYHIMRLENREPIPVEEVQDRIRLQIKDGKYNEMIEEWKKDPNYTVVKNQPVYDGVV